MFSLSVCIDLSLSLSRSLARFMGFTSIGVVVALVLVTTSRTSSTKAFPGGFGAFVAEPPRGP